MTDRKRQGKKDVDRRLREALSDDLTPPEEARLRSGMRRAWAAARENGTPAVGGPAPLRAAVPMAEAALGVAAGLLLALSLALHLALPPRLVAASLSVQNASLRVASQMRRAVAMTCVVETLDEQGLPQRTLIDWRAPDGARVRVEGASGGASWFVKVPPSSPGGFAGGASGTSVAELGDARSRAVSEFLSPDHIEKLLAGRWDVVEDEAAGLARTTFDVARGQQRLRVTIDRTTDLPLRLQSGWTATLAWTLGEEAPLPFAGAERTRQGGSR